MKTNKIVCGIFAHVDAGKTTLAESMLYTSGNIRKAGRVDHGDAFLDTYDLEKSRGITIFSKQALLSMGDLEITLLDTPGHVDFSAEMERTLQVLDYAILVISAADGIQGHVLTLWHLLEMHQIPTFIFINKMDQDGVDKFVTLEELQERLSPCCIDFSKEKDSASFYESIALSDETLLEQYLNDESVRKEDICRLIAERKVFPCYFGSALKMTGVTDFLVGMQDYVCVPHYDDVFGAKVFKISRDTSCNRLIHLKITGGSLKVKQEIEPGEKVDQIRLYSGDGFQPIYEASSGTICAVTGLTHAFIGKGYGVEEDSTDAVLVPLLTYQMLLPEDVDVYQTYLKIKELAEEEPELHLSWEKEYNQIHVQVMGEVQLEILENLIAERFGLSVSFDNGSIVYKETIATPVEGCGHYEPLRHYAEVRLLLEPLERGQGLQFECDCSQDVLDLNWQRLIYTHLAEKAHRGVLIGAEITDMRISLLTGRAHLKHTEGGDFRQATYRAIRQGLRKAESILLEPVYAYRIELPSEYMGRAMSDIQQMKGTFHSPEIKGEIAILHGVAPVIHMRGYQKELLAYTKGYGRLFCTFSGYLPCHNSDEIVAASNYSPEEDIANPTGSVFCSHGAGFVVPWDEVDAHMHTESPLKEKFDVDNPIRKEHDYSERSISEEEIKEIFSRTFRTGGKKKKTYTTRRVVHATGSSPKRKEILPEYLLVDGYNIIFAWDELKELAKVNIDGARNKLIDYLCNYQGYKNMTLIVVFDAYKVKGNPGEIYQHNNIYVVYTKEAETADQYIEKTVHEMGHKYNVTVATSDAMEQMIIMGQGAIRMSAQGLWDAISEMNQELYDKYLSPN